MQCILQQGLLSLTIQTKQATTILVPRTNVQSVPRKLCCYNQCLAEGFFLFTQHVTRNYYPHINSMSCQGSYQLCCSNSSKMSTVVLDPSKVVHFQRIQHRYDIIFGGATQPIKVPPISKTICTTNPIYNFGLQVHFIPCQTIRNHHNVAAHTKAYYLIANWEEKHIFIYFINQDPYLNIMTPNTPMSDKLLHNEIETQTFRVLT